ncbi:hypothetical protein B7494_g2059 [Chlorociboria aeruginascens]|nr:hypothetical protein B7494_g2059 [Chlorociboria aeruginascens]
MTLVPFSHRTTSSPALSSRKQRSEACGRDRDWLRPAHGDVDDNTAPQLVDDRERRKDGQRRHERWLAESQQGEAAVNVTPTAGPTR